MTARPKTELPTRKPVASQGPGLVAAQHGHRGDVVKGAQARDEHTPFGKFHRAQGGRQCEGARQRDWRRGLAFHHAAMGRLIQPTGLTLRTRNSRTASSKTESISALLASSGSAKRRSK